jgi:hypothetical protein
MSDEIADVLAEGREYIETHGWWRGGLIGPNGKQACSLGGLLLSQNLGEHDLHNKLSGVDRIFLATQAIMRVVYGNNDRDCCSVDELTWWNDHSAKDKQEVLDAFAKAEKIERAGFDPDA